MLQFILRRLGLVIPTFIGITLLTFAFVHMIPGDPVMIMAGERGISPERHAQLLAEMGLDKPLWQQYAHYIWGVLHGDLGISLKSRIPVWQEFVPRFKATLELGVCAMIFAVAVGIPVGVLAAVKRGSIFDHTAGGLALTGYSMPIFWWGMMLIMLVSVQLNLTPVSGRISDTVFLDDTLPLTGFMLIDTAIWGEQGDFIDALMHMILPAIVLGTIPLAVIVRMTRSSMLEVLGEDYIRTARAKGLTRMRVIVIHALRNAMLPVVTVIGLQVGTLLAGAILTETIFSWPGLGRWLIDALQRRDYPVVQGQDDMEYINKNVYGEFELSGAIFLSCLNKDDFSDSYNLVYGHNMKNGGMFADVADFTNKEYFETHQKGKLYLTDATRKIRFFACMKVTAADAKIYHPDGYRKENLKDLLDYIQANAVQYRDVNVADENSLIALSTCSEAETNGRVVLIGKLEREVAEKQ